DGIRDWSVTGVQTCALPIYIDDKMIESARSFVEEERLTNVRLVKDDLFASALPERAFDLVHARFQIAPLGRGAAQVAAYRRLAQIGRASCRGRGERPGAAVV